jgi:obg-like ATPase 1
VNPVRDLDIISEELRLKDEENLLKSHDKVGKLVIRGGGADKKLKPEYVSTHINQMKIPILFNI